jgi:hypothetical protein
MKNGLPENQRELSILYHAWMSIIDQQFSQWNYDIDTNMEIPEPLVRDISRKFDTTFLPIKQVRLPQTKGDLKDLKIEWLSLRINLGYNPLRKDTDCDRPLYSVTELLEGGTTFFERFPAPIGEMIGPYFLDDRSSHWPSSPMSKKGGTSP